MADETSRTLVNWAKAVITLLPLLALIWGASTMYSQVQRNTKDLAELKAQQSTQLDRLSAQIADLNLSIRELQVQVRMLREGK